MIQTFEVKKKYVLLVIVVFKLITKYLGCSESKILLWIIVKLTVGKVEFSIVVSMFR